MVSFQSFLLSLPPIIQKKVYIHLLFRDIYLYFKLFFLQVSNVPEFSHAFFHWFRREQVFLKSFTKLLKYGFGNIKIRRRRSKSFELRFFWSALSESGQKQNRNQKQDKDYVLYAVNRPGDITFERKNVIYI